MRAVAALSAVSLCGCAAFSQQARPAAEPPTPQQAYAACPGQDVLARAASIRWQQTPAAEVGRSLEKHRALRDAWNAPVPEGDVRILWYGEGGDLGTTRISVMAVRRPDGIWHTSGVGDSRIWIEGAKATQMPPMERDLAVDDSRRLDQAIADPCLYAGPTFLRDPNLVAGGQLNALEILTPEHRWSGSWHVLPTLQEKAVISLIGSPPAKPRS